VTLRDVVETTARPRVGIGTLPRRSRRSASKIEEVAVKSRLLLLLVNLALLAAWLGKIVPQSWSDGH
jgi:hypothetical protein